MAEDRQALIIETCARAAHESNRAYCLALGLPSVPWETADEATKASARSGVQSVFDGAEPAELHTRWLARKQDEGWIWGPVKDLEKKEHPCFLPYSELPFADRQKDTLFRDVVRVVRWSVLRALENS